MQSKHTKTQTESAAPDNVHKEAETKPLDVLPNSPSSLDPNRKLLIAAGVAICVVIAVSIYMLMSTSN